MEFSLTSEVVVRIFITRIIIVAAISALIALLFYIKLLSYRFFEGAVVALEYIGSIIVGISVMPSTGMSLGEYSPLVQVFNPWLGIILINFAFFIKILLFLNPKTP